MDMVVKIYWLLLLKALFKKQQKDVKTKERKKAEMLLEQHKLLFHVFFCNNFVLSYVSECTVVSHTLLFA
jgi:hypothetical protein